MANQRDLKAFVRYDGSGRVVAGSLVLRKKKPKVGRWEEILTYECCNPTTTTTTTSGGTTTTTSSSSTSTTTSTSSTSTTTTTGIPLYPIMGVYYASNGGGICSNPIDIFSPAPNVYCTTPTLQSGSYVYNGNNVNSPILAGIYISNTQGEVFATSYDFPGQISFFPCS